MYLPVLVVCCGYSHAHFALQAGSTSQEELADNVVLKQFLDRIILDRIPVKGGLDPDEKQRAMVYDRVISKSLIIIVMCVDFVGGCIDGETIQ